MRYSGIDPTFYIQNRKEISISIGNQSIAIVFANEAMPRNGDQFFPFRQNSDFFYLTGIEYKNVILLLAPGQTDPRKQEVLFIEKPDPQKEKWEGKMLNEESAFEISGITTIHYIDDFEAILQLYLADSEVIYLNSNEYPKYLSPLNTIHHRKTQWIKENYPLYAFGRLQPLLIRKRVVKQSVEIERIKQAIRITGQAFNRVLEVIQPGIFEYEIEAEIIRQFIINGSSGHAYPPIVACGENALYLHYTQNHSICKENDLLLLDFGAEYANYAADCSRTIPVNGRFNARQRAVYVAVHDILKSTTKLFVPGQTISAINSRVVELIQEKLIDLGLFSMKDLQDQNARSPLYLKYYYHGVSHFLGLDVHDPGSKELVLEEGMILTCEPGIYIPEERMGIRLENDILVARNPIDLMSEIPIEIEEIETLIMNHKTRKNV